MKTQTLTAVLPQREPKIIPGRGGRLIPVCEPTLGSEERAYVDECIRSGWISFRGRYLVEFERKFSRHFDAKYAIACSSGTAALHLALAALGIKKKEDVIIPTFTMIATANAVTYLGAQPVLVDTDINTWNIDIRGIEQKITQWTKAIIPVHTYGLPVDMDAILYLSKKHRLFVIEDAAEAHGAEYKGRKIGSISDATCFSFYANKIITTGEGGMVTTNNRALAEKIMLLRDHAFSAQRHFWHKLLGFNYKMSSLQAALGCAQLERLNSLVEARIKNARYYNHLLKDTVGIRLAPQPNNAKNVYWMSSIIIEDDFGISRNVLRAYLARHGIETRPFFIPIHLQPFYAKNYKERFPVAEELCQKGINLPSAATLKKTDIEYIVRCIKSARKTKG